MATKKVDRRIAFAATYGQSHFKTFNAFSALWRAEDLIAEVEVMDRTKAADDATKGGFGYRFGTYEAVSYYAVAFVTCLEWHARSRLADLLTFDPEQLRPDELKSLGNATLVEAMKAELSVPQLVGASSLVSSIDAYLDIFERVLNAIGAPGGLKKALKEERVVFNYNGIEEEAPAYTRLERLFEYRHRLVHEIGMHVIGHPSIRELWLPDDASKIGNVVCACIRRIEAEITRHAPHNFPNKLSEDGSPGDDLSTVKEEIEKLEKRIAKAAILPEEGESWTQALNATHAALERETHFIKAAEFLRPLRYLDVSQSVELELYRNRARYLRVLNDEIWEDRQEPDPQP
ncbi:MAG: hypothetical protein EKK41_10040 [Hyphomicrobiales bacterium]|nr:MAG: hypothetical protein EKK41_10040 [Hyphomicrobiales bacterium]